MPNASSHAWALPPGWSSDDIDQDNSFTATTADVLGAAELCVTVYLGACSEAGCMTIDVGGPIGIDDADQGSTVWVSVHPEPFQRHVPTVLLRYGSRPAPAEHRDALGQVIQAWTTEPARNKPSPSRWSTLRRCLLPHRFPPNRTAGGEVVHHPIDHDPVTSIILFARTLPTIASVAIGIGLSAQNRPLRSDLGMAGGSMVHSANGRSWYMQQAVGQASIAGSFPADGRYFNQASSSHTSIRWKACRQRIWMRSCTRTPSMVSS
ncbi:MAG: hypothetical protein IPH53_19490 [Flavobacteriales bacterium]|nr:hypothetical protein [Flavobacteriales bacterium]